MWGCGENMVFKGAGGRERGWVCALVRFEVSRLYTLVRLRSRWLKYDSRTTAWAASLIDQIIVTTASDGLYRISWYSSLLIEKPLCILLLPQSPGG